MSDFNSLDLLPSIKEALANKGYEKPTPIQAQAIPHLLKGKDLLGIAQTGTGKTAAFSLPILNRLGKNPVRVDKRRVRCLILTPTRELASQIADNIKAYGKGLNLTSSVVFGGVGKQPQVRAMAQGRDILVATPGRLLDLMSEGHIKYDQLEVFVLDEADRMLDMGFINDVKKVIAKLPKDKQTLLFSATMPKDIANLANSLLKHPERVEVTPESTTVEKIQQKAHLVAKLKKPDLLIEILKDETIESMLVFTRTKHGADRVVKKLAQVDIQAAAIHGNKSQNQRERALGNFRDQKIRVLVATDIAARGIDIPQVSHVINYNPPEDPKSYVHRIGRTGRAGREGIAILFCDETEVGLFRDIQKHIKLKIDIDEDQPFHEKLGLHPDAGKRNAKPKKKVSMSKKARRRRSFRG
ncbi:MAG: DEAD/DEAH box helicase [Bacteriovoracaceae bacterium]|nr:DEAD/DEAH box helicase [Bacteriovoracaceae bacterium]